MSAYITVLAVKKKLIRKDNTRPLTNRRLIKIKTAPMDSGIFWTFEVEKLVKLLKLKTGHRAVRVFADLSLLSVNMLIFRNERVIKSTRNARNLTKR
jgi:hypothetical protein